MLVSNDIINNYILGISSCNTITYGIIKIHCTIKAHKCGKVWRVLYFQNSESIVEFKRCLCQWKGPIGNCRTCLPCNNVVSYLILFYCVLSCLALHYLSDFASSHLISSDFASSHLISCDFASSHLISSDLASSYLVLSCLVFSCIGPVLSCLILSYLI